MCLQCFCHRKSAQMNALPPAQINVSLGYSGKIKPSISTLPWFSECRSLVPPYYYQFLLDADICKYQTRNTYVYIGWALCFRVLQLSRAAFMAAKKKKKFKMGLSSGISPREDLGFYCLTPRHNHVYLDVLYKIWWEFLQVFMFCINPARAAVSRPSPGFHLSRTRSEEAAGSLRGANREGSAGVCL